MCSLNFFNKQRCDKILLIGLKISQKQFKLNTNTSNLIKHQGATQPQPFALFSTMPLEVHCLSPHCFCNACTCPRSQTVLCTYNSGSTTCHRKWCGHLFHQPTSDPSNGPTLRHCAQQKGLPVVQLHGVWNTSLEALALPPLNPKPPMTPIHQMTPRTRHLPKPKPGHPSHQ